MHLTVVNVVIGGKFRRLLALVKLGDDRLKLFDVDVESLRVELSLASDMINVLLVTPLLESVLACEYTIIS